MSKPFDVTTKYLVETRPNDWLAYLGIPHAQADVIDADLAAVSAEADKVLRVHAPTPWLAHLEFQASHDETLPERTLQYSVLLRRRHGLPVQSILLLLRPEADGSDLSGALRHLLPDGSLYLEFAYQIMRVWQAPVETLLTGGLGVLPLAPLAAVSREQLPGVVRRMEQRIRQEAAPDEAGILWTATYVLMGLRYPPGMAGQLLQGVRQMKESTTYQAILEEGRLEGREEGRLEGRSEGRLEGREAGRDEGRAEEARTILLRLGTKRFGVPPVQTQAEIAAIASVERLERLTDRVLDVESWEELLTEA